MKKLMLVVIVIALFLTGCSGDLVADANDTREVLHEVETSEAADFTRCQMDKTIVEALTECVP